MKPTLGRVVWYACVAADGSLVERSAEIVGVRENNVFDKGPLPGVYADLIVKVNGQVDYDAKVQILGQYVQRDELHVWIGFARMSESGQPEANRWRWPVIER